MTVTSVTGSAGYARPLPRTEAAPPVVLQLLFLSMLRPSGQVTGRMRRMTPAPTGRPRPRQRDDRGGGAPGEPRNRNRQAGGGNRLRGRARCWPRHSMPWRTPGTRWSCSWRSGTASVRQTRTTRWGMDGRRTSGRCSRPSGCSLTGALLSIRQGMHELLHPAESTSFLVAYVVLAISAGAGERLAAARLPPAPQGGH